MTTVPPTPTQLQRPLVIVAAVLIGAAGVLMFNMLPVLLGTAADAMSLGNEQIGWLGSFLLAGFAFINISAVVWVRRVNWRVAVLCAAFLAVTALLVGAVVPGYPSLLAALFVAGLGTGFLWGVTLTLISDTAEPDRFFGIKTGSEIIINASILLIVSLWVLDRWGFTGVMTTMAVAITVLCLSVFLLPARGVRGVVPVDAHNAGGDGAASNLLVWIGLGGLVFFYAGQTGVWVFIERIGVSRGFDSVMIARALAFTIFATGVGGLAAGALGDRFGRIISMAGGFLGFLASATVMLGSENFGMFFAAMCLYGGAWQFVVVYQIAIVANADVSGRLSVLVAAAAAVGSTIGPAAAGYAAGSETFIALFVLAGVISAAGIVCSIFVHRRIHQVKLSKTYSVDHGEWT